MVKEHDEKSIVNCIQPNETTTLYRYQSEYKICWKWSGGIKNKNNATAIRNPAQKEGLIEIWVSILLFCSSHSPWIAISFDILYILHVFFVHSFRLIQLYIGYATCFRLYCFMFGFHLARESDGLALQPFILDFAFHLARFKAQNSGNFSLPLLYMWKHVECKVIFFLVRCSRFSSSYSFLSSENGFHFRHQFVISLFHLHFSIFG